MGNWTRKAAATVSAAAALTSLGVAPANAAAVPKHCVLNVGTGVQHCSSSRTALTARADGDVVQGTFFDGPDYTGNSLTITGPELCKKDGWVNWQFDLGDDWKNKISSVQPWGNCWIWLYPEPNLSGDRDGPFKENTGNVGSFMDDRTQSIGFS
ncbi:MULTISPECIES: hypothetical protein [unclassified Amycolatopsis]|uniref:hypothetical protein n=1 Tax=unclassified Amycolatopsis TaxID=2618356 RepID=UPI001FF147C2|nr:hypothetical protein [Amycolatopsis sp. FBCC-B4732]UOX91179.1 hypothetical protein MUY14_11340 [Amycolatopsis sp. FBCC-B4732]